MTIATTDTITVLSTPGCSRCKIAAKHLTARGIEFTYIDVTQDEEWADWMRDNNLKNVPQIIRGDERVEGLDFDAINRLF
jgi:glutaredoxin